MINPSKIIVIFALGLLIEFAEAFSRQGHAAGLSQLVLEDKCPNPEVALAQRKYHGESADLVVKGKALSEEKKSVKRQQEHNAWVWQNYLQPNRGSDGSSSPYAFNSETASINLKEDDLDKRAARGEKIFKEQKLTREKNLKRAQGKLQQIQTLLQNFQVEDDEDKGPSASRVTASQKTDIDFESITSLSDMEEAIAAQQEAKELKKEIQDLKKKGQRTLHVIPHSHTDEGWLSTTEDFFSGDDEYSIYVGSVKDILDSVMGELTHNDNYTFTFAEIKYFKQWYDLQDEKMKKEVKELIREGRLDLVSGGWSAPDEATTQYDSLLDNLMIGQRFLQQEFKHHPSISWQIDAFGVSTGYARLAHDVGFDALFFSRADMAEKQHMRNEHTRTQVWRPHEENLGRRKDVLSITIDQQKNSSLGAYCWPGGFWADTNYLFDVPIVLDREERGYKFDKLARSLYQEMDDYLKHERTNHVFRPFGCDMAYVDAKLNYKIMNRLFEIWDELGLNEDIQLKWSTPTKYIKFMKDVNEDYKKKGGPDQGWPLRRDDTFPYAQDVNIYMSGFYTSRPHLKKNIRELTEHFHSSLGLISSQVLCLDGSNETALSVTEYQNGILDTLGVLQHHDAITGTSANAVVGDFNGKALFSKDQVDQMNQERLAEVLLAEKGIDAKQLDSSLKFTQSHTQLTSDYGKTDELLIIIQNPSMQQGSQLVEEQLPYYNYTIHEVTRFGEEEVAFEKFLPRLWKNSNRTAVKSLCLFKVNFTDPWEQLKVFRVRNLGVVRVANRAPTMKFEGKENQIWNLNLPVYLPRFKGDVDNFQTNYKALPRKLNVTIEAGSKSLRFIEVKKPIARKLLGQMGLSEQKIYSQDMRSDPTNQTKMEGGPAAHMGKPGIKEKTKRIEENDGAVILEFKDAKTGLSQKFGFNLRYYIGATWDNVKQSKNKDKRQDGAYEFAVNGTAGQQRSYKYGAVNLRKSRVRQNNDSAEFLIIWEQKYSGLSNGTDKTRAFARIQINTVEEFIKFEVSTNEIPIAGDKTGKDVLVDWFFMDGFQTKGMFWVDANGLQMIPKRLFYRREYVFTSNNTVSSNYYPVTSALAIRDMNETNLEAGLQKQVVIMNDRSQGASAGLRYGRNVEFMHQRRFRKHDHYGVLDAMNDLDQWGRGIQVQASYFVLIQDLKKSNHTMQRRIQRESDQPLLFSYSHDFELKIATAEASNKTNQSANAQMTARNQQNASLFPAVVEDSYFSPNLTYLKQIESQVRFFNLSQYVNCSEISNQSNGPFLSGGEGHKQSLLENNGSSNATLPASLINSTVPQFFSKMNVSNVNSTCLKMMGLHLNMTPNLEFKQSSTLKTLAYSIQNNTVQVRVANLMDHFDADAKTQHFDVNAWAREYFLQANKHLLLNSSINSTDLLAGVRLNITEMNLSGALDLGKLSNGTSKITKWKTPKDQNPVNPPLKPKDVLLQVELPTYRETPEWKNKTHEPHFVAALEPQRIRVFQVEYSVASWLSDKAKAVAKPSLKK